MKKYLLLLTFAVCVFLTQKAFAKQGLSEPPTVVSFNYTTPFMCMSADNPIYGAVLAGVGNYLGGTFSSSAGLAFDPVNGGVLPLMSIPGTYVVTYTLAATQDDPEIVSTVTIHIIPPTVPEFGYFPTQFCRGDVIPALPIAGANGITGTWSPALASSEYLGNQTYTFTPDAGLCAAPYVLNIEIVECPGIKLTAFLDSNANGMRESGEVNFPLGKFSRQQNNTGPITQALAPTGTYTINDVNTSNSYDVDFAIVSPYESFYQATTTAIDNLNTTLPHVNYEFPVTILQSYQDLQLTIVPVGMPRPGFLYQNTVVYANQGNVAIASGSVVFSSDADVTITSVSEPGANVTGNGFTLDFTNLQPFESRQIDVTMQVPTIPTVSIGQLLTNAASVANQDSTINDAAEISQVIIGSYDPNDKMERHGPEIVLENFGADDALEYTIRFENTGSANAEKIRIVDDLDGQLNADSFVLKAASHPVTVEKAGTRLTFLFNDAQLPPSVAGTNIGHGYVTFSVKPQPLYAIGDVIPNRASIYFDFNPAIVTNEWTTSFVAPLATKAFAQNPLVLYPNPASGALKIYGNTSRGLSVSIYDMLGKLVISGVFAEDTIDIEKLEPGLYMVSMISGDLRSTQKLIVK